MMIVLVTLALLSVFNLPAFSQRIWEVRKGCVRSQGNLGGGYLFQQKAISAYVNGEMELFFDDRFAYTGAVAISFLTNRKNETGLKANHALFFGGNYHFIKPKRWDPYIGLTPGVGLVRATYKKGDEIKTTPFTLAPLLSAQIGCNFYVCSFLHFFAKVQGMAGQMFSTLPSPQRLDELKFTGGMGWNFRIWKPKMRDTWAKEK
jgi:hypothetical protein